MTLKDFLHTYSSNTLAASGNQTLFYSDEQKYTGRIFYKIRTGGRYNYAFIYSDVIDSTFDDGSVSRAGTLCGGYTIHSLRAGVCRRADFEGFNKAEMLIEMSDTPKKNALCVSGFTDITFDGHTSKVIDAGAYALTDPISLSFESGDFLCLEITYSGKQLPYHNETIISAYLKNGDAWQEGKTMPFPAIIGCDRPVAKRIAYIGDSITQGSGTPRDSYTHWCAVVSEKLDESIAAWNMGYGFARALDAASDGSWLYKAKQNDAVCVCFGVNDIFRERTAAEIKLDLKIIVGRLLDNGIKVLVQTPPPFNYLGKYKDEWEKVCDFILGELPDMGCEVFDNRHILGKKDSINMAEYGDHPNSRGCKLWGEALYPAVNELLETV